MESPLLVISSKATGPLLTELAQGYKSAHGVEVKLESIGGVDAARRVAEGEAFDVVVLDAAQITKLAAAGKVPADSARPMVRSVAMLAVRAGAPQPAIGSVDELKAAFLAARAIGFSTGPSGVALLALIEGWGLKAQLEGKLVQAQPGRPVGAMIAQGEVEIGMQQYSELMSVAGIAILGPLPPGAAIESVFTASVCAASSRPDRARRLVEYLVSAEVAKIKARQGFEPV